MRHRSALLFVFAVWACTTPLHAQILLDHELEVQLANEVGANVSFGSDRRLVLRFAAALGDRSALSLGVHLGAGRRELLSVSRR